MLALPVKDHVAYTSSLARRSILATRKMKSQADRPHLSKDVVVQQTYIPDLTGTAQSPSPCDLLILATHHDGTL